MTTTLYCYSKQIRLHLESRRPAAAGDERQTCPAGRRRASPPPLLFRQRMHHPIQESVRSLSCWALWLCPKLGGGIQAQPPSRRARSCWQSSPPLIGHRAGATTCHVIRNVAICQYFFTDNYVYLLIYLQLSRQKYLHIVTQYFSDTYL
jgi:hypothetical protein